MTVWVPLPTLRAMPLTRTWPGLLDATLVSDAVRPHLEPAEACAVHSIFQSVLNLETRHGLITISGPSVDPLPHGLRISTELDYRSTGLRSGQLVILERHRIRISGSNLEIDLRGAAPWSPRLPVISHSVTQARWRDRAAEMRCLAAAAVRARPGAGDGMGALIDLDRGPWMGAVARIAGPRLERLAQAVRTGDRAGAGRAAESLVGLGPGLTPSGDDALVGMAAALTAMAARGSLDAAFLGPVADAVPARTTTVSATFLRHASAGQFAAGVHQLMGVLIGPDASDAQATIERCVAYGATSGADTLVGILLGLDALAPAVRDRPDALAPAVDALAPAVRDRPAVEALAPAVRDRPGAPGPEWVRNAA